MIKEGSVLRCIDARDTRHLKDRYLYVVSKVCYGGSHVELVNTPTYQGRESTYSVNRFEEIESDES